MNEEKQQVNHNSEEHEVTETLDEISQEIEQLQDQNLRLRAEIENMRKRFQRDSHEIRLREREEVVRELLPVLDSIDRALQVENAHKNPWYEGFKQIDDLFFKKLEQLGVKPIPTSKSRFDPKYHEAMSTVAIPNVEDGYIYDVIETGYILDDDRLLRPAKVVVVKNS